MKYTVVTTTFAEYQLATIWLRAIDRQYVTNAFDRIDSLLKNDPEKLGEPRPDGFRSLMVHPLIVTFEVNQDDRKVIVRSVRFRP
jgi:hypothetical protein